MAITTWTDKVWNDTTKTWDTIANPTDKVTTHEGMVLAVYSRDVRVMSDVWDMERVADVWDADKGCVRTVRVALLDYSVTSIKSGDATVDATPEVLAALAAKMTADAVKFADADKLADRARVARGKVVNVVSGREKGKSGRLFWIGEPTRYGSKVSTKVGIALDNVKDARGRAVNVCWTYMSNLEVAGFKTAAGVAAAEAAFNARPSVSAPACVSV